MKPSRIGYGGKKIELKIPRCLRMESRRSSTATTAPAGDEFLRSMAQIRDKLRKRFLRKPLYLEAAHSYKLLAARELQLGFPEGAATAWNAAGDVYAAFDGWTLQQRTTLRRPSTAESHRKKSDL
ncbi:hypothetical protein BIW11_12308 [Tropilaelaps mercedesae]|uniref:Uncharacterized protein n=1 Tax=Tropilaelaps mercedesae TaxID=418985 RepID=A0A1V9X700_9ACAR|nr:hypothetical protein BIW11_12308 [Tropilaelaps mercedesae]